MSSRWIACHRRGQAAEHRDSAMSLFLRASAGGLGQVARGCARARPAARWPGRRRGRGVLGHRIVSCQGAAQRAQPVEGA